MQGWPSWRSQLVAIAAFVAAAPIQAIPSLVSPPTGATLEPGAPIVLDLGDMPDEAVDRSYLLLDDVDVTDFAVLEGARVTLRLPTALGPGGHRLELVELLADGDALVRASWILSGGRDGALDVAYLSANMTQSVEVRVADGDLDRAVDETLQPVPEAERVTADGSARVELGAARDMASISARAPFLWNSEEDRLAGRTVEIGPWLISADAGPAGLQLGHHRVGPTTLVMDGFDRRGASGSLSSARLRTKVTGFAFHGSPVVGFDDDIGLSESRDRVYGAQVETRLLELPRGFVDMTATYLGGESSQQGSALAGVAGDPARLDGRAWSVRGHASLLDGRFDASSEYAWSRSKFAGARRQTDDAHFVGAAIEPLPELTLGAYPVTWRLRFDQSDIGTYFQSLANPGLPQDRVQFGGGGELAFAGLWVTASGAHREDNVENASLRPTLSSETWSVVASFGPDMILQGRRPGVLRQLGMPTLQYHFYWEDLTPDQVPSGFAFPAVLSDRIVRDHFAGVSFDHTGWSWSVGYAHTDTDDRSTLVPSSRLERVEGSMSITALPRIQLYPRIQYEWERREGGADVETLLIGTQLDVGLVPGMLHAFTTASYSRRVATGADADVVDASGAIRWTVAPPASRRPGLQLSLRGSYQGVDDQALRAFDRDVFQIFLRATLGWGTLFGQR